MRRGWWFAALLAVTACGSDMDDRPVSFTYIHTAIILPNCATSQCHSTEAKAGKYDLQKRDSAYHVFLDPAPSEHGSIVFLLNGGDDESPRMPRDQPLPKADIALIEEWFAQGAMDN